MDIEISIGKGVHTITSDKILCCNETGRVIAVFYNDYDLILLQEELETLRASDRIKQANIEILKAENVHLKTELLCMEYDRDALLAGREAMMKQEPVGYKVNDTKNNSQWITAIQNPEKYKLDYPDFVLTPVYDHPLSASQQINKSNQ